MEPMNENATVDIEEIVSEVVVCGYCMKDKGPVED